MPSGMHQVELAFPNDVVWNFVKDMNNWAPLIPNYIHHEKLTQRQSTWEFKSDTGILKKKIRLVIDIKEWKEPTIVSFDIKGQSEKYSGEGFFEVKALNLHKTRLTGFLEVNVLGAMGASVNSILKIALPKSAQEMAKAITSKLEEQNRNK
jgi:carbon monoxide dehydrogenase subunit G